MGSDVEKEISVDTLQLLLGQESVEQGNVPGEILLLAKAIDDPYCLPFIIEEMDELEIEDENMFRFALLRVQIDSELRMNEDIQMHQRRRYVAQVIEKMIFGELLIEIGAQFAE
ncbi:MAG: hypothetical protein C5S45_09195 [Candidatus Methanocomedens sp.]|nr:MAG: hypothetical protein C5S45_09195 [ANME-2 cluster archaeon]